MNKFRKDCLEAHNIYRRKHGVPPLKLSLKLSEYAQEWAENLAARSVMQHRDNNKLGENIYYYRSSNPNHQVNGKDAVDSWYDEINQYTFGVETRSAGTGHFTQVVWRDSAYLCVGMKKNSKGQVYVVCNYDPPGNYIGQFSEKVLPPARVCCFF